MSRLEEVPDHMCAYGPRIYFHSFAGAVPSKDGRVEDWEVIGEIWEHSQAISGSGACVLLSVKYTLDMRETGKTLSSNYMNTAPSALSDAERAEISKLDWVRDMWGATEKEFVQFLKDTVYAVKFDYVSGGPGYCGDYFILQGDALGENPVQLIRDGSGSLVDASA